MASETTSEHFAKVATTSPTMIYSNGSRVLVEDGDKKLRLATIIKQSVGGKIMCCVQFDHIEKANRKLVPLDRVLGLIPFDADLDHGVFLFGKMRVKQGRHVISGRWYEIGEKSYVFTLTQAVPSTDLSSSDGDVEFNGSFRLSMQSIKEQVLLAFKESDGGSLMIKGEGNNECGEFEMDGLAKRSAENSNSVYDIQLYKQYSPPDDNAALISKVSALTSKVDILHSGQNKKIQTVCDITTLQSKQINKLDSSTEAIEKTVLTVIPSHEKKIAANGLKVDAVKTAGEECMRELKELSKAREDDAKKDKAEIMKLHKSLNQQAERMDSRIDAVGKKAEKNEQDIVKIKGHMNNYANLRQLSSRDINQERRLSSVEDRSSTFEARYSSFEARQASTEARLRQVERAIALSSQMTNGPMVVHRDTHADVIVIDRDDDNDALSATKRKTPSIPLIDGHKRIKN